MRLIIYIALIVFSTKASHANGQPLLNYQHAIIMSAASSQKARLPIIVNNGRKTVNREGIKYGRLTAIQVSHYNERDQAFWLCRCDCGVERPVFGGNLTSGQARSCGCLQNEKRLRGNNYRHGHAKNLDHTREYDCWISMKARVYNPKNKRFHHYGGKGVVICARWLESFPNFLADMGPKPTSKHSIHRKDNDGDYEPENCIWATNQIQAWEKSTSHMVEFQGQTKCVAEWAGILGINMNNVYYRLKAGWSAEDALTKPVKKPTSCAS